MGQTSERKNSTAQTSEGAADHIEGMHDMAESMSAGAEALRDQGEKLVQRAVAASDSLWASAKKRPLLMAAAAGGVGFVLGAMLFRRD